MERVTKAQVLGITAFSVIAALWTLVHIRYGQTEGFRVWGIGLLVVSALLSFCKSIPVNIGHRKVAALAGWRKVYVVIPAFAIGCLVSLFPHAVACGVHLKGYVCS